MHGDHEDQDRPYDWTVKAPPIPVPRRLSRPHPIVRATSDGTVGRRADADGRLTIGPRKGVIYTRVSRLLLGRALRIAQGLISEANRRGWDVAPVEKSAYGYRAGAAIVIGSHSYRIEIAEQTQTLPFTAEDIAQWRSEYSWRDRSADTPPPQRKRKRATGQR